MAKKLILQFESLNIWSQDHTPHLTILNNSSDNDAVPKTANSVKVTKDKTKIAQNDKDGTGGTHVTEKSLKVINDDTYMQEAEGLSLEVCINNERPRISDEIRNGDVQQAYTSSDEDEPFPMKNINVRSDLRSQKVEDDSSSDSADDNSSSQNRPDVVTTPHATEFRTSKSHYDEASRYSTPTPDFVTNSTLSKLRIAMSFKRSKNEDNIKTVMNELVRSEKIYIDGIQMVLKDYWPYLKIHASEALVHNVSNIVTILQQMFEESQKFLILLQHKQDRVAEICQLFIESGAMFGLYLQYSNTLDLNAITQNDLNVIRQRQEELRDKLGLASLLTTPLKRVKVYVYMLEYIKNEFKPADIVNSAIQALRKVAKNDIISLPSEYIRHSKIDINDQGQLIRKDLFKINKPKKMDSIVFLFERAVVFTSQVSKAEERFEYIGSIAMDHLTMSRSDKSSNTFCLADYSELKNSRYNTATSYELRSKDQNVKEAWVSLIQDVLSRQAHQVKYHLKRGTV